MARFALFTNGVKVETLDDLKDNFNIKDMENNFRTRSLHRWLAEKGSALVKMANILYKDRYRGNYQLNWDYLDFKLNGRKKFPMDHKVKFTTPDKEVKFEMMLNYLGADEDWEPRTEVSGKYRQVSVDEILRRFMAL